ncbi:amidohydrolase [Microterricola viridarii]|uniref:amidohydrolase n=1 Tax=Microterricola viridarii TaxID=412690 RepID=UPI000B21BB0D|nr:amidohydrolase [Microterricola viridarii]
MRSPPPTDALLVVDGVIAATGQHAIAAAEADSDVEVVDLVGAAVIPGFIDAHIHTGAIARELDALNLRGCTSLAEALDRVSSYVATREPGTFIVGGRWDSNAWEVPVQPDRYALDAVSNGCLIALPSVDGHTMWANSLALEAVGYSRDTPDPVGGEIVRDAAGEPTGILREAARYPLRDLQNVAYAADLLAQLKRAQAHLLSLGLTGVHDIDAEDVREAYLQMQADGELHLRVHKMIPLEHLDGAIAEGRYTGQGDDWFTTGPVKIFSDGALGSHTSHMGEDFAGEEGNHGIEIVAYPELVALARKAASAGIAVATHAIGDEANHLVLNAYEEIRAISAERGLRNRIEHSQHIRHADIPRFAELGILPSLQPTHCTSDIPLANALLAGRELGNYAWRSLTEADAQLVFGSDAPIEDPTPMHGIHAAVTRQSESGEPAGGWEPAERLSVAEAISAYTYGGAYAAGQENKVGRLAPGQFADFIVLEDDPFAAEPESLRDIAVLTTVVGGAVRFQR